MTDKEVIEKIAKYLHNRYHRIFKDQTKPWANLTKKEQGFWINESEFLLTIFRLEDVYKSLNFVQLYKESQAINSKDLMEVYKMCINTVDIEPLLLTEEEWDIDFTDEDGGYYNSAILTKSEIKGLLKHQVNRVLKAGFKKVKE